MSFLLAGADHALVEVMGEWTDTMGETIAYGARGLRGVTDGFGFTKGNTGMYVRTVDAGLVKIGELLAPFPNPALEQPEALEHGMSVVVHANSWSTNFPLWFVFCDGGASWLRSALIPLPNTPQVPVPGRGRADARRGRAAADHHWLALPGARGPGLAPGG